MLIKALLPFLEIGLLDILFNTILNKIKYTAVAEFKNADDDGNFIDTTYLHLAYPVAKLSKIM